MSMALNMQRGEDQEWEEYKQIHGKAYSNEQKRREIWSQNRKKIAHLNSQTGMLKSFGMEGEIFTRGFNGFTVKMNKYGDLTDEEFSKFLNGFKAPKHYRKRPFTQGKTEVDVDFSDMDTRDIPISVDWRNNGYVTDVKDQGYCGCCYVFAATAALEGLYAKQYGKLYNMSEQNFLDCAKNGYFVDYDGVVEPLQASVTAFAFSTNGCNGGNADAVLQYAKYNSFVLQENDPYTTAVSKMNQLRFIK